MKLCLKLLPLLLACLAPPGLNAAPYQFKSVQVHGGGFVTAIVFHPLQSGLCYARTDMGGAYRWDGPNHAWIPLTDFLNRDQSDDMGVLALAIDPSNLNN